MMSLTIVSFLKTPGTNSVFFLNTINMMFPSVWHKLFNDLSTHKTHSCDMKWFLCLFLHRINTLSRICALHNAKICFCNIRWSSSNMNGALKDVSQKHNTDFLSKWTLPFALLHLHVMRVWYFRITQYFSGMVNAITHWLSLVRFPPIWQNGHRITRWIWRQQFKMAGGWDDMTMEEPYPRWSGVQHS